MVNIVVVIVGILMVLTLFMGVITLLGFLAYYLTKQFKTIPPDLPMVVNWNPNRSGGYALGLETEFTGDKFEDRIMCKFLPRDVKYDEKKRPVEASEQPIVLARGKRISIPKGSHSSYREIVHYLPEHAYELPENFRNTLIGQAVSNTIELLNVRDSAMQAIKEGDKARAEIIRQLNQGELTDDLVKKLHDYYNSFLRNELQKQGVNPSKDVSIIEKKL